MGIYSRDQKISKILFDASSGSLISQAQALMLIDVYGLI